MDLSHIVVAMKGDKIVKAQCKTCNKEHAYKAPKGAKEPAKKKSKASKAEQTSSSIEAEWEKLMTSHKDAPVKGYTMKGKFLLGDKLKHPSFGEGIVSRLIYPNKIEVVFREDVKIMIYGGQ
ncbi:MAG: hypothetical protein A2583_15715 [Bdellovibrionales bacterium RIFOXYD1_FULL_53_11]|nr:MAG: hypothetical protein A2583_15715 [Bdellovibrionales bacterium RIFOXYD1_FULL_53_11]